MPFNDKYISNDKNNLFNINDANGFLFDRKDAESLYKIMYWVIKNRYLLDKLSQNARAYSLENLDIKKRIQKYKEYYSKL